MTMKVRPGPVARKEAGFDRAASTVNDWQRTLSQALSACIVLVELDEHFRSELLRLLTPHMAAPERLLQRLSPKAAAEVAEIGEEEFRRIWYGPGGRGEAYD